MFLKIPNSKQNRKTMNLAILSNSLPLFISLTLSGWLIQTLHANHSSSLIQCFHTNDVLAGSVNHSKSSGSLS